MGKVGSVGCAGFLVEGTGACVVVDEAGSCLSGGQDHVQWCVLGCQHWSLLVVEWSWVLALRRRSVGELLLIHITWGQEVSGGPMS